ncbi:hypothetical protein BD769DRAFT_1374596, partial [Suillus cothurnatus]
FSLSSVTSWRSVDGNFDYVQFWCTIVDFFERPPGRDAQRRVDFFERPPGRDAQRRVDRLLEWWSRCVIYFSRKASPELYCLERFLDGATVTTSATRRRLVCPSMLSQSKGHNTTMRPLTRPRDLSYRLLLFLH